MRAIFNPLILGVFLSFAAAPAFAAGAVLEAVTGPGATPVVQVKRAGTNLNLKKGDELRAGDELTTDRAVAVDIRLEDRTLIRVGVNSSYRLEEDSSAKKIFHRLMNGIVRVLVPKGPATGAMKLEMRTADGTIGVRGTEFVVIKSEGETQLKGLEGEVTFGGAGAEFSDAKRFVPVRGGFESRVKAGAAAPAAAVAFDLPAYLKTLDAPEGPFRGLVKRASTTVKSRSATTEVAVAPAPAAPAAKARPSLKAQVAKEVKKEAPSKDPNSLLFLAANKGDLPGITAALKAGADVKQTFTQLKVTALHAAVLSNNAKAVVYLVGKGADANARDVRGRTPLMTLASDGGNAQLVIALEEGGSDESLKDADGKTALQLAQEAAALATDEKEKAMYLEIADAINEKK